MKNIGISKTTATIKLEAQHNCDRQGNCDRQRKLKWKLKLTNATLSRKDIENENEHDLETQKRNWKRPRNPKRKRRWSWYYSCHILATLIKTSRRVQKKKTGNRKKKNENETQNEMPCDGTECEVEAGVSSLTSPCLARNWCAWISRRVSSTSRPMPRLLIVTCTRQNVKNKTTHEDGFIQLQTNCWS